MSGTGIWPQRSHSGHFGPPSVITLSATGTVVCLALLHTHARTCTHHPRSKSCKAMVVTCHSVSYDPARAILLLPTKCTEEKQTAAIH